jgi:hypothetical protein
MLAVASIGAPRQAAADEVLDWSITGFAAAAAGGQNAAVASRTMAMLHLAVHDALNAIDRRYHPYVHLTGSLDPSADSGAAIATAAREVLIEVIPGWGKPEQRAKALAIVDGAYAKALAKLADGPARRKGAAVGKSAAAAMLAQRRDDGSRAASSYTPSGAPGKWRPHPNPVPSNPPIPDPALAKGYWPPILPHWGRQNRFTSPNPHAGPAPYPARGVELKTLALPLPWSFRPLGPPPVTSPSYAEDFDKVRRVGGKTSTERTAEQSEIARYWYEGSPDGWSRIARVVAAERRLDRWDNARLLALVHPSLAQVARRSAPFSLPRGVKHAALAIAVVIAHRPSALAAVDLLLVLKDGEAADFGPREHVLARMAETARQLRARPQRGDGLRVVQGSEVGAS